MARSVLLRGSRFLVRRGAAFDRQAARELIRNMNAQQTTKTKSCRRGTAISICIGIGAGIGAAVGVAIGEVAQGVAVGVALGAAVGAAVTFAQPKRD